MKKIISSIFAVLIPMMVSAQVNITFETEDYKAIGVYDTWANSPFRTGELKGNVAVVTNDQLNGVDDLYEIAPNPSEKILAFQRSRFGSNTFGVRIDLPETFELTTKVRYVHCLLWKPTAGRVMLVGLGKRKERAGQSQDVEQFWMLSRNTAVAGHWNDMVFEIKGAGGIDIYSLVIVPDCESTHNLTEDFACYIDNVCVNYDATPSISSEYYPVNAGVDAVLNRSDRYGTSITLNGSVDGTQSLSLNQHTDKRLYQNFLSSQFTAKAGETLTPSVGYKGTWMSAYAYIDFGMDGKFDSFVNDDGTIPSNSDIVSYSYFNGKNSKGESVANGNTLAMPSFTLAEDLEEGFYRLRYKVDWDNLDAGGNTSSDNSIVSNGGFIADVRLNIHGDYCTVNDNQLNGEVLTAEGEKIENLQVPFAQPLTIKMNPAPGFTYSGIRVRHGHNLSGDAEKYGTVQWVEVELPSYMFKNDEITLPASIMDGDVRIEGVFIQETSGDDETDEDYPLTFNAGATVENPQLASIVVTGTRARTFTVTDSLQYQSFVNQKNMNVPALPGSSVNVDVTFNGTGKQAFLYFDLNQDGHFTSSLNGDGTPTMVGELVSYTYYNEHNSLGEEITAPDAINALPSFSIPDMLPAGVYRARLVISDPNIDPASGDYIVDFLVNVYNPTHRLELRSPNGRIISTTAADGIPETVTPYTLLPLKFAVSLPNTNSIKQGYTQQRMIVRKGHNLDGPQYVHGNCQWWEYGVTPRGTYNIPADTVTGDLRLIAAWEADGTENYHLVFEDEFDEGSVPSEDKWSTPTRYSSAWNRYISDSELVTYLENGRLVCRAMATPDEVDDTAPMITGAVQSRGHFGFQYGYIEVRAKTNPFTGNFPAIWLMPEDGTGGWPTCGEIDIWETINATSASYFTVHSNWTYNLGNTSNPVSSKNTSNYVLDGVYHNYGLLWTAERLTWYVDGTSQFVYTKSSDADALAKGQWPFDKKFYIILNQSVGNGSWASNPDLNYIYETDFDWVRVYQTQEDSERDGNTEVGIESVIRGAENDAIYDLSGRRIESVPQHGIYIRGNRKIIVR